MQAAAPGPQQPSQHPQHAQQQQQQLPHSTHQQHAQQQSAATAAGDYANWFQTSSWGSRWSNAPPVPSQTPNTPQPPSRASAATIDLTLEDDSSPSPSSSSDYHIVSVQAQQPALASDRQMHSEPPHFKTAGGMSSVAGGKSAILASRAEAPMTAGRPTAQMATQAVGNGGQPGANGETQPDASAASSGRPRAVKRRRWDVMPADMSAAAQHAQHAQREQTAASLDMPTAAWHARDLPTVIQHQHREDFPPATRREQTLHAHRLSQGERRDHSAEPIHARHKTHSFHGRGTYTTSRCELQNEAAEPQLLLSSTGRCPAAHAGRAVQDEAPQVVQDAKARDHHHKESRRRHKSTSRHHSRQRNHGRRDQDDVTAASDSRYEQLEPGVGHSESRRVQWEATYASERLCKRHAGTVHVGEQQAQSRADMYTDQQEGRPDSASDDRWQLWRPGMHADVM